MPTYVYEILSADGEPTGERFETQQSMKDDALTQHPETGEPVRRAILAPNIAGEWSDLKKESGKLSNKNLDRLGFTKYERKGKGNYEKQAGQGPDALGLD